MIKWWILVALLGAGAALIGLGFFYDVLFAGLPYQDPPADLEAAYNLHAGIASGIRCAGAGVCGSGWLALAVLGAMSILRRRRDG